MTALVESACSAERLLSAVRAREPDALAQLTRCYGQRLLAAGQRSCRSPEEARDAVQDAWVTASLHLDEFRGEGSLEGCFSSPRWRS